MRFLPAGTRIQIEDPTKPILLATYGTLRLDRGNWQYFLRGKSTHIGTCVTTPNYTMYGLNNGFPIVVPEGDTPITVDVFRIHSNTTLTPIHGLEGFSGIAGHESNWYDVLEIDTPWGPAYMYYQKKTDNRVMNAANVIRSGNWNNKF